MKTIISILLLLFASHISDAQGVHFERGLSWQQIKEKAKAENKLIFVDCYATWCGPCKQMDKEVYTSQKVGDYLNKRFISVKLQIDRTETDAKEVKDWYTTVDTIKTKIGIEGYPTFLFLTGEGKLLHKGIGYRSTGGLIMMASDVIGTTMTDSIGESEQQRKITNANKEASPANSKQLQEYFGKVEDYGRDSIWSKKAKAIDDKYRKTPPKPGDGLEEDAWVLNMSAWQVFEECFDEAILKRALAWSEVSIALDKMTIAAKGWTNVQLLDTRANLLHKLGRTEEAIVQEKNAISTAQAEAKKMGRGNSGFADSYLKILIKMEAGQPTWPE